MKSNRKKMVYVPTGTSYFRTIMSATGISVGLTSLSFGNVFIGGYMIGIGIVYAYYSYKSSNWINEDESEQ